jgi:protein OPY2
MCMDSPPTCPENCASEGKICQFTVSLDCTKCAQAICIAPDPTPTPKPVTATVSNTGAIAGGVAGGVILFGLVIYLAWRFFIKTKRQPIAQEIPSDDPDVKTENEKDFAARRDQRSSMHTVHSVASTVLTRASNIIQIAYIPGVTNRATPTSPTLLVPPVPPIPMAVSNSNSSSPYEEQHFFVPGDLRDSTYSGLSNFTDRTSYARTSFAPRSSIASTIYGGKNAIIAPAHTAIKIKPAVVSVKSTGAASNSSGSSTPPVPSLNYEKYRPKSRDSSFSIGSTFVKNASAATATQGKAQVIRVGSNGSKKAETPSSLAPPVPGRESTTSNAVTLIDDSPAVEQSPFADPPERPAHRSTASLSATGLSAVIEEATRQAARVDRTSKNLGSTDRERSPFGDEHATED